MYLYFCYFIIISPWKKEWLFILTNLNPLHQNKRPWDTLLTRDQFQWINTLAQSNDYAITLRIFFWELNGWTWVPFTQRYIAPSLVELGSVLLEKKIFKLPQCIFTIWLLFPFNKGHGPSFQQTWIVFTKKCFIHVFIKVELDSVILKK